MQVIRDNSTSRRGAIISSVLFPVLILNILVGGVAIVAHHSTHHSETGNFIHKIAPSPETLGIFFIISSVLIALATFVRVRQIKAQEIEKGISEENERIIEGAFQALNSHSIVSISDADRKITYVNDAFTKTFGYSRNEAVGAPVHIVYEDGVTNETHAEICGNMVSGSMWQGKQTLRRKNGERVTVSSTFIPILNKDGERTHVVSIRSDITESEDTNNLALMGGFLGEIHDGIYVYDTSTLGLVYANKAACDLCDWDESEITRKRITHSSKWFQEDAFWKFVGEPLLNGERAQISVEVVHEKGPVEITTRVSKTPSGQKVFLSVLHDLSAQKQVEKARMDSISEISHELRTPLTSIKGSLKLLDTGVVGDVSPKAQQVLQIASRNTDRLLNIVNDILDFQKLEAGMLECEKMPLELDDMLSEAISANAGFCAEHDVGLDYTNPPFHALVNGDRSRLLQVIANLISNAVKYSPKGDTVTIKLSDAGKNWRVSVSDNGPGIPDEARERIFESFGQIQAADGIKRKGTGLGLAICRKIVGIHKGRISFRSVVNEGAEFFFDLPKLDDTLNTEERDDFKEAV